MTKISRRSPLVFAVAVALVASLLEASPADATGWTNARYLFRYVFWGIRSTLSKSNDWKLFPYRTIDN